ncbi:MAG: hypothetical protein J3K34DRAFT_447696 [Monoraphidium minutum]|nr:MAG: hypothetical protein J3K34DRAFT_447696 [Monoraphidium minutum]
MRSGMAGVDAVVESLVVWQHMLLLQGIAGGLQRCAFAPRPRQAPVPRVCCIPHAPLALPSPPAHRASSSSTHTQGPEMALSTQLRQRLASSTLSSSSSAPPRSLRAAARPSRGNALRVRAAAATEQPSEGTKTLIQKAAPGDLPFPWSEKDPYKLPVSIDRVQRMLITLGWEKPWVEQIIDRVMKGMLRTNEERCKAVIDYLASIGLQQDQICNMASISVVLLGVNPDTRLRPVVEYVAARGVPKDQVADVVLKNPRIFEYKVMEDGKALQKGAARIQVDALPLPTGQVAVAVNYFREGTSFVGAPVSPLPPAP